MQFNVSAGLFSGSIFNTSPPQNHYVGIGLYPGFRFTPSGLRYLVLTLSGTAARVRRIEGSTVTYFTLDNFLDASGQHPLHAQV